MTYFLVPRSNDHTILDFLDHLSSHFDAVNGHIQLGGRRVDIWEEENVELVKRVRSTKAYSIEYAALEIDNQRLHYRPRQRYEGNTWATNPQLDTIDLPDSFSDDFDYVGFHAYLDKHFKLANLSNIGLIDDSEKMALGQLEIIQKLEQTIAEIGEKFAETRLKLEEEFTERKSKLEEDHEKRKTALEESFNVKTESLELEAEKLKQREDALDDRDNTHVRREIRNQFKESIGSYKEKFELTKGTRSLRNPVHLTVLITLILIVFGVYGFSIQNFPNTNSAFSEFIWYAKPIGLTIAGLGLISWYLKWITKWSERHAQAEFELRKLEMDMDRASWVVESSLEWKDTEGSNIPDHLLEALSRNLFSNSENSSEESQNAADQLASALLGEASKASLNIGGHSVEFDRKALKKAGS